MKDLGGPAFPTSASTTHFTSNGMAQRDELLEALKDVLRYVSPVAYGAINARAAIKKVEENT